MTSLHAENLEALLDSNSSSDRAELKVALLRLSAELRTRSLRSSQASFDFFSSAVKTLARIKGSTQADLRMECLFDCVSYFFNEGFQSKALDATRHLSRLAGVSGNASWVRKSHTLAGVVNADIGNTGEALINYARALEICRELKDLDAEAIVLSNSGVALNYAGLYREAIPCFQRSAELCMRHDGSDQLRRKALINHAQSLLYLEEFREGYRIAEIAIKGTKAPETVAEAASLIIKEMTFVQLALELGRINTARAHSKTCLEYARLCDSSRAKVLAEITVGLCEVHGGRVDRGVDLLERALDRSLPTDPSRTSVLVSLVKACDLAGNPEKALIHMKALLENIRSQREKGLAALLAIGSESMSQAPDLQALELREARLEARVAERQMAFQRIEVLERLAAAADLKEDLSGAHGYRVGELAAAVARALGWSEDNAMSLSIAARLHDIGKIAMPDRILLSSKELQAAERHFMSTHTTIGAELLGKSNIPQLRMAEEIARYHHEWWNGEGYPSKLKGKRIPIHARIVALADVFDALTHGRPFSPAWPIDKALDEIKARKGTQFDPELTDIFLDLVAKLRSEHDDLDEYLGRAGKNSPFLQARHRIRQMLADEREHEKMATVAGNETRH